MDTAGLPVDPALVRVGDHRAEEGLKHARGLLRLPDPPTVIFTCDDALALGVFREAGEGGLRIPHDLSVVGFDDLRSARWTVPPLAQTRVEPATGLVIRDSTAPPRR
jgi:LacI family transcriptional regulator, xylobiose transport system transcriptional regulator